MSEIRVEDIMTKDVITVHPSTSVSQLLEIMMKHHHMGYPVVKEGKLIGIVTFEDIMKVSKDKRDKVNVEDIAKRKLITAYPKDTVLDAFEKMSERKIGHLLIVDPENKKLLRGILTRTDIMYALKKKS